MVKRGSTVHYTKRSDLWCEYMEYMRSVICLLGYDIMNVVFCRIVSEWKWGMILEHSLNNLHLRSYMIIYVPVHVL